MPPSTTPASPTLPELPSLPPPLSPPSGAGATGGSASTTGTARPPPSPSGQFSLSLILQSASGATLRDVLHGYDDAVHSPCFRKALAWGGGVALALGAHSTRAGRPLPRAFNLAFLGFLVTFYSQWYMCKEEEYYKRMEIQARLKQQRRDAAGGGVAVAGHDDAALVADAALMPRDTFGRGREMGGAGGWPAGGGVMPSPVSDHGRRVPMDQLT